MQSSQSTIDVSRALTDALQGRVLESVLVGVDGAFSIRCQDGTVASLACTTTFTSAVQHVTADGPAPCADCSAAPAALTADDYRPKFPAPLQDLILQSDAAVAPECLATKPPAQRVTISGINGIGFGMGASKSGIDWERVVTLPSFQLFAEEMTPNADGKNSLEHAIAYVEQASKSKKEADFFQQYAEWFDAKGYWPAETPLGSLKEVK
ncbi:hypothetical protein D8I35_05280 [Corticibacter populi]|uniref:Uncharacterized protein n=1 Tax=Corticibacter populi TaxID=1550736 RepID=A0A3M6QZW0_9BURK|nr:hypothetical protein [Corticibacter populi]RMX08491.1 hypothetical protein D8I35_05280 [Corticibacter populi]RZS35805.1 hypothetical protein EV687_0884 [Corticibacter populi]